VDYLGSFGLFCYWLDFWDILLSVNKRESNKSNHIANSFFLDNRNYIFSNRLEQITHNLVVSSCLFNDNGNIPLLVWESPVKTLFLGRNKNDKKDYRKINKLFDST